MSPLGAVRVSMGSSSRACWVYAWVRPELGWMPGGEGEQKQCVKADDAVRSPHTSMRLSPLPAAAASHSSPLPHSERFTAVILCMLPALTGAVNHPLTKTHWGGGTSMAQGAHGMRLPQGGRGELGTPAGYPNPEVGSTGRPRTLFSLGKG